MLKLLDFLRRPVTGQVCDSCSSVADLNETRIAEIIAQQLQESRTCPRARTPEVCLAVCICLCVFLLILRIVIDSATRVQVSTRSVRTGSARNSITALQWEAGRKRFARLLIMLSLRLADEHTYSCELPPTLLSDGDFKTICDFEILFLVGAAYTESCILPGTLGLWLQRAKTLPAHRQICFSACEVEKDVIASCLFLKRMLLEYALHIGLYRVRHCIA